jgi:hypothetical protein
MGAASGRQEGQSDQAETFRTRFSRRSGIQVFSIINRQSTIINPMKFHTRFTEQTEVRAIFLDFSFGCNMIPPNLP